MGSGGTDLTHRELNAASIAWVTPHFFPRQNPQLAGHTDHAPVSETRPGACRRQESVPSSDTGHQTAPNIRLRPLLDLLCGC